MAIDFDKWNKEFGGAEAVKELEEASKNEYTELADGTYLCNLEKLELGESKAGKPMVKGMFRVVEGSHKNQCIFYNQVFTRGFPQHKALEFLRSLEVFDSSEIDFDGDFNAFNDLLLDIAEEAASMTFEVVKSHDGEFTRLEVTEA
ncbi:DUF669 domain-containing protein [Anaerotignum sp.]